MLFFKQRYQHRDMLTLTSNFRHVYRRLYRSSTIAFTLYIFKYNNFYNHEDFRIFKYSKFLVFSTILINLRNSSHPICEIIFLSILIVKTNRLHNLKCFDPEKVKKRKGKLNGVDKFNKLLFFSFVMHLQNGLCQWLKRTSRKSHSKCFWNTRYFRSRNQFRECRDPMPLRLVN